MVEEPRQAARRLPSHPSRIRLLIVLQEVRLALRPVEAAPDVALKIRRRRLVGLSPSEALGAIEEGLQSAASLRDMAGMAQREGDIRAFLRAVAHALSSDEPGASPGPADLRGRGAVADPSAQRPPAADFQVRFLEQEFQ